MISCILECFAIDVIELGSDGNGPFDGRYLRGPLSERQYSYRSRDGQTLSYRKLGFFQGWILNSPSLGKTQHFPTIAGLSVGTDLGPIYWLSQDLRLIYDEQTSWEPLYDQSIKYKLALTCVQTP